MEKKTYPGNPQNGKIPKNHWLLESEIHAIVHYRLNHPEMERARSIFPGVAPDLITDNGPQFIAKEFNRYLQLVGITHRKTRFFYPQNGKIERFFQSCKNEAVRRQSFLSLDDLKRQIENYIQHYNYTRLHSAIGDITPIDMLAGRQSAIFEIRRFKLKIVQEQRKLQKNQLINPENDSHLFPTGEILDSISRFASD